MVVYIHNKAKDGRGARGMCSVDVEALRDTVKWLRGRSEDHLVVARNWDNDVAYYSAKPGYREEVQVYAAFRDSFRKRSAEVLEIAEMVEKAILP
jgi:hypothetical protein